MDIEWGVSCIECKFIGRFKDIVGIEHKDFLAILRGECPICRSKIETYIDGNSLVAKCDKCMFFEKYENLNNLEEKYLKDKEWAFIHILPKCPECGSSCKVFIINR